MDAVPFTVDDEDTLACIAEVTGVALHNYGLLKRASQVRLKSKNLLRAMRSLQVGDEAKDLEENIDAFVMKLVSIVRGLVDAERYSLYLVDTVRNELWCNSGDPDGASFHARLKFGDGIAGFVAQSGETYNIPDAWADERFERKYDEASAEGFRTRALLTVPIHAPAEAFDARGSNDGRRNSGSKEKPRVLAVVQCINATYGVFTQEDTEMLEVFGAEVGAMLQRRSNIINFEMAGEQTQDMLSPWLGMAGATAGATR